MIVNQTLCCLLLSNYCHCHCFRFLLFTWKTAIWFVIFSVIVHANNQTPFVLYRWCPTYWLYFMNMLDEKASKFVCLQWYSSFLFHEFKSTIHHHSHKSGQSQIFTSIVPFKHLGKYTYWLIEEITKENDTFDMHLLKFNIKFHGNKTS